MLIKDAIETVTFTTKGQIVIPRRLRRQFEIEEGTKATVETTPDGILIKPVTASLIRKGRGMLKKRGKPLAREWSEQKAEERELEERKYGRLGS